MSIALGKLGSEDGFDGDGSGVGAIREESGVIVWLCKNVLKGP